MIKENQKVIVKWHNLNKEHFINKGYIFTKFNDEFEVNVDDLPKGSHSKIIIICDYCGKEFPRIFKNHVQQIENNYIKKDSCLDCKSIKTKQSNYEQYGVSNISQLDIIKEKVKNTIKNKYGVDYYLQTEDKKQKTIQFNLEKYGVEFYSQTDEYKDKYTNTCLDRYGKEYYLQTQDAKDKSKYFYQENYGVENYSQIKEFKDNVLKAITNTKFKNGSVNTSFQQLYINDLLNGSLNYPCSYYFIDIALIKDKIAIEYDGGGHKLSVKFGFFSEEMFSKKEIIRNTRLYKEGWKIIKIITSKDLIPSDDIIVEMINYSRIYFAENHHWIKFYIDNNKIINSQGEFDYNYGELRKIKKEVS